MSAKQKGKPRPQPVVRPVQKPAARVSAPRPKMAAPPTQFFLPGFWRRHWLPALLLVALAFALYGQAVRFGYVLDDEMVLWRNAYVKQGFSGWKDIFGNDTFKGFEDFVDDDRKLQLLPGGRYRPLSLATFAAEVSVFGQPGPGLARISHFINILLYGLTGVLLYRILLGLFPSIEKRRWWFGAAFFGAALFVLHPLHVEAVANIKGRDEILALLGSLGALYFTLKYFDTGQVWRLAVAAAVFLLGLLSKENALTFLAVIPLTAWFFGRVSPRRLAGPTLLLAGAGVLFILIKWQAQGYLLDHGKPATDLMNNPFLNMKGGEKLATIFLTLGWYVKLLFWPHPLTHDYYPYQVPKVNWSDWRALASLALYAGMALWALLNLRRRVPAYAIAFFLLTLSIVSNLFVPVGTFMNERFVYMPSVAFCLLAGWFLARQIPRWTRGEAEGPNLPGTALFVVAGAVFAWLTVARVPDWATKLSLNTSAAKNSPNSARAHCFYAIALFEEVYKADKKKPPAEQMSLEAKMALVDTMDYHLTRATKINPKYFSAWRMVPAISFARFELQRDLQKQNGGPGPQMDRLFNDFRYTLQNAPKEPEARRYIVDCVSYLATNGGNPNKIVSFCYDMGYEYYFKKNEVKDPQMALRLLEAGLKTQFEDVRLFNALAEVYQAAGNPAKAAEMRQRAEVAETIDQSK